MDRVISLLAALVGLIALGGAILVHTNADVQQREMATQIAQLKASMSLLGAAGGPTTAGGSTAAGGPTASAPPASSAPLPSAAPAASSVAPPNLPLASAPAASMPSASAPAAAEGDAGGPSLKALQDRIASLEQTAASQAAELEAARARLAAASSAPPASVATAEVAPLAAAPVASSAPASTTPAAIRADGPSKDCIPLGTRFMGQSGDSFPLCKTRLVLKVAAVMDGLATVSGAGDVAVGATVPYDKGCLLSVFSADDSGYAEMRVTCQ